MTEKNAAQAAARAAKRKQKLGPDAVCVLCGFSDASALDPVSCSTVEKHHVLGREHDGKATLPVCANCHRSLTVAVRDAGADMKASPEVLECVVNVLRALGTCLIEVGRALIEWANKMVLRMKRLDYDVPEWRETERAP